MDILMILLPAYTPLLTVSPAQSFSSSKLQNPLSSRREGSNGKSPFFHCNQKHIEPKVDLVHFSVGPYDHDDDDDGYYYFYNRQQTQKCYIRSTLYESVVVRCSRLSQSATVEEWRKRMRADGEETVAAADAGGEDEKTSRENAQNEPRVNDRDGDRDTGAVHVISWFTRHHLHKLCTTDSVDNGSYSHR